MSIAPEALKEQFQADNAYYVEFLDSAIARRLKEFFDNDRKTAISFTIPSSLPPGLSKLDKICKQVRERYLRDGWDNVEFWVGEISITWRFEHDFTKGE